MNIATDPSLAVGVACWFWTTHKLNTFADNDDLETITRRVNGGLNGLQIGPITSEGRKSG